MYGASTASSMPHEQHYGSRQLTEHAVRGTEGAELAFRELGFVA